MLPAAGGESRLERPRPSFTRRWRVLIGTLIVGVLVLVLIALLWSRGPGNPDPRALPPPSGAQQ